MRVFYKWSNCNRFYDEYKEENNYSDAFLVEIHKDEINDSLFNILKNNFVNPEKLKTGEYFKHSNRWAETNPELANINCAYVLVNKDATMALLCDVHYPYAGMWNAYNPFKKLYEAETNELHKNHGIIIKNINEIKNIDKLIENKIRHNCT